MASIAQVKPDMAVLGKDGLPLSPFGLLSQAFAEEIYSHAGGTEGFYDLYDLTFLEEGGEEPEAVPAPLVQLHVDLKLVLQQMKERGQGGAAERIVEKVLSTRLFHECSAGRLVTQRQRAGDTPPGRQGQKLSFSQSVYRHGKERSGGTRSLPRQAAGDGKKPAAGAASSLQGAVTGMASVGKWPAGVESFRRMFTGARPFERASAGANPFRGPASKPEPFREMPIGAVFLGKGTGKRASFQEIPAGEASSGIPPYGRNPFNTKAAEKRAFTLGNTGPRETKTIPAYTGMGRAISYTPDANTAGSNPEAGTQSFLFPGLARESQPMEWPRPARTVRQTGIGLLSSPYTDTGKPGRYSAAEAMPARPGAELVFYQEPDGDAPYRSPMASAGKGGFPALNISSLAGFLLKSLHPLPKRPQDSGTERLGKARQSMKTALPAVQGPSAQIQETDASLPFTQDGFSEANQQLTVPFHPTPTIRTILSGWTAQAEATPHSRAGTELRQAGRFNFGQLTALPYNGPVVGTDERAAGRGLPANPGTPWLSMGWDVVPEALHLEYAREPAALPVKEVPFQPRQEADARKFSRDAAKATAVLWKTAFAEASRFSANHPQPGASRPKPEAYHTATHRLEPSADRPSAKRAETIPFRQDAQPIERLSLGWNTPRQGPQASGRQIPPNGFPISPAARQGGLAETAMLTASRHTTAVDTAGKARGAEMERKQAVPFKSIRAKPLIPSTNPQKLPGTWAGPSGAEQAVLAMEQSGLPALIHISRQLEGVVYKETAVLQKAARPEYPDANRHLAEGVRTLPDGRPRSPGIPPLDVPGTAAAKPDGKATQPGMASSRSILAAHEKGLPPLDLEHVGETAGPEAMPPSGAGAALSHERLEKQLKDLGRRLSREPGHAAAPSGERRQTRSTVQGFADASPPVPPGIRQQPGTIRRGLADASASAEPAEGKPLAVPEKTAPVLQNLLEKAVERWAAAEAGPAAPVALPAIGLDYHTEAGLTRTAPLPGGNTPVSNAPSASPRRAAAQQALSHTGGSHPANTRPPASPQGDTPQTIPYPMLSHRAFSGQGSIQAPISHPMLSHRTASCQGSPTSRRPHTAFPRQPETQKGITYPADIRQPELSHRMPLSPASRPPLGGMDTGGGRAAGVYAGRQQEAYPALQMTYSTPFAALARDLRQAVGISSAPAAKAMAAKAEPEPMQTLAQIPQPPQIEEQIVWQNPYMRAGPAETAHRQKPPAALQGQQPPQARVSDAEIRRTADKVFKLVQEKIIAERRRIGRF